MINYKSTKFKIELNCKSSDREDLSHVYENLTIFIESISDVMESVDINTKISNETIVPKYTGKYEGDEEVAEKEISQSISKFKEKFYQEENFEHCINSLPNYEYNPPCKSLEYVKNYLIKNRSGRLRDIVHGCSEEGVVSKNRTTTELFNKRLIQLIKSGHVRKEGWVYIWNYDSE